MSHSSGKKQETGFHFNIITKVRYQMLSDVTQAAKYGTATKESALQILLLIQILLYAPNA